MRAVSHFPASAMQGIRTAVDAGKLWAKLAPRVTRVEGFQELMGVDSRHGKTAGVSAMHERKGTGKWVLTYLAIQEVVSLPIKSTAVVPLPGSLAQSL